jgi:hypothetical protein
MLGVVVFQVVHTRVAATRTTAAGALATLF